MKPDVLLRAMFQAAVDAALPEICVPAHLPPKPKGRTIIIGAGKASGAMAKALEDAWEGPLEGLVVTRYGYRVPCLVVSPYARRGHISVEPHSHLSLLRFASDVFGLPPLNGRVAASSSMADCFDFTQPPRRPELPPDPSCGRRG